MNSLLMLVYLSLTVALVSSGPTHVSYTSPYFDTPSSAVAAATVPVETSYDTQQTQVDNSDPKRAKRETSYPNGTMKAFKKPHAPSTDGPILTKGARSLARTAAKDFAPV